MLVRQVCFLLVSCLSKVRLKAIKEFFTDNVLKNTPCGNEYYQTVKLRTQGKLYE